MTIALVQKMLPFLAPLEAAPIAILIVDVESRQIIFVNKRAQLLLGETPNELTGGLVTFETFVKEIEFQKAYSDCIKYGAFSASPCMFKNVYGEAFEGAISASLGIIAGRNCLFLYIKDVTNECKLEGLFSHTQVEFEESQRLAEIGNWRWDIRSDTVKWSKELYRLTGQDPNRPAPNYEQQRLIYTDESFNRLADAAELCIHTGVPYELSLELKMPTADRHWMLARGEPIFGTKQKVIAIRGTLQNITERVAAKDILKTYIAEIEDLNQRATAFIHNASDGFHILDPSGTLIEASDSFCEMLGYERQELIGQNVSVWDAKFSPNDLEDGVGSQLKTNEISIFETRHRRKDRSEFEVEITGKRISLANQELLFNSSRDITIRRRTEVETRLAATVFDAANEAITITDATNTILQVNDAFERITGYDRGDVIGKNPSVLSSGRQPKEFYQRMWAELLEKGRWSGEIWNRRKSGEFFPEWLSVTRICDEKGNPVNHVAIFTDITEQKAAEDKIHQLAFNDPLTGLPNRRMMLDRLQNEVDRCLRLGLSVAVLYIDLDYFKAVNDHYGHLIGDELLIQVAKRTKESIRRSDIVGRLSGDEFLVIMPDVSHADFAAVVAETVIARLAAPFLFGGSEITISASVGISISPDDAPDIIELLKFADIAMYEAKKKGRNTYVYFSEKMNNQASRRMELNSALRNAILREELWLAYQPQVDLETSQLVGMEALIRWTRANGENVSPAEFIPIAEENGLIVRIGEWVVESVCKQIRRWRDQDLLPPSVAINVSGIQIGRSDMARIFESNLATNNLEPSAVVIEITESVMMEFTSDEGRAFERLTSMGSEIAIDDFGTGYSSLAYLTHFAVAKLKIDRAFVQNIAERPQDQAIVGAVTLMAKKLGMKTIAEGVETSEQAELVRQAGVDIGQGYFWSKPLGKVEMRKWLVRGNSKPTENE